MIRTQVLALAVLALMGSAAVTADEYYAGGMTVDIDRDVLGYLWIEDATVNLYKNAHIKNDYYLGDVYIASGAVVNVYGGQIDNMMMISTMYNGLPDPVVTVYGTDFAVDGVAVEPGTNELFIQGQTFSGVYEDGSPFAYIVECYQDGNVYLTLKLNWLDAAPPVLPDIEAAGVDFGEVGARSHALGYAAIANMGDGVLTVESVTLQDETEQFFVSGVTLPAVIEPGAILEIALVYVPAAVGSASASLTVVSNDPDEQTTAIALSGIGTEAQAVMTPLEQMDAILAFFKQGVEEGTIAGVGKGKSAGNKCKALGHMLKTARYLIEHEYDSYAAEALYAADLKTDGQGKPVDFVAGEAVSELNRQIEELYNILKGS